MCLENIKKELEACKSSCATEKKKSTVIPEFYEDNGLTAHCSTLLRAVDYELRSVLVCYIMLTSIIITPGNFTNCEHCQG